MTRAEREKIDGYRSERTGIATSNEATNAAIAARNGTWRTAFGPTGAGASKWLIRLVALTPLLALLGLLLAIVIALATASNDDVEGAQAEATVEATKGPVAVATAAPAPTPEPTATAVPTPTAVPTEVPTATPVPPTAVPATGVGAIDADAVAAAVSASGSDLTYSIAGGLLLINGAAPEGVTADDIRTAVADELDIDPSEVVVLASVSVDTAASEDIADDADDSEDASDDADSEDAAAEAADDDTAEDETAAEDDPAAGEAAPLAQTGSNPSWVVIIAVALIAAGIMIGAFGRRLRAHYVSS